MPHITPMLWFDTQGEEAAAFYTSIFPNSSIDQVLRYDEAVAQASGRVAGSAMVVDFTLDGQPFTALNGGPQFQFSEAISLVIHVADQGELDYYWNALIADGGEESYCGWLKDKFGLSWQVVPSRLGELLAAGPKASEALMGMRKIIIADLEAAEA